MSDVKSWREHAELFLKLYNAKKVDSIRAYCDLYDLNYNSARKHLKIIETNDVSTTSKNTRKSKNSDTKQVVRAKKTNKKSTDPSKKAEKTPINQGVKSGSVNKKNSAKKVTDPKKEDKYQEVTEGISENKNKKTANNSKKSELNQGITKGSVGKKNKSDPKKNDSNQGVEKGSVHQGMDKKSNKTEKTNKNQLVEKGSVSKKNNAVKGKNAKGENNKTPSNAKEVNKNQIIIRNDEGDESSEENEKNFSRTPWDAGGLDVEVLVSNRDNKGRFVKGHNISLQHGFYAQEKYKDIRDSIVALNKTDPTITMEGDLLSDSFSQYLLIKKLQDDSLLSMSKMIDSIETKRRLEEIDKKGKANHLKYLERPADDNGNPLELSMLKVTLDTSYALSSLSGTMAGIYDRIHQRQIKYRKLRLKERAADIIEDAYLQRDMLNATAYETARYIESRGVQIPRLLQKEAEIELTKRAEDLDKKNATNDDFLEAAARKYEQAKADRALTLEQKRNLLADIMQSGDYSNFVESNMTRTDREELPESEIDYEATRDLYDEDD